MLTYKKLVEEKRPWEILSRRFGRGLEVIYITSAHIPLARTYVAKPTTGEVKIYSLAVCPKRRGNGFGYQLAIPAVPSKVKYEAVTF